MKIKCKKQYYFTGELLHEIYHKEDDFMCWHQVDGAAHINYYRSGQKRYESYYQNGLLHRIDGPAIIWYSENGEITETGWRINGDRIKPTNLMKLLWKKGGKNG